PDRLISNHELARFFSGNCVKGAQALTTEHVIGESRFALFKHLTHTDNGSKSRFQRRLELQIDRVVGLSEVLAALGVADDDVSHANHKQHGGVDFARKRALLFPVNILSSDGNIRTLRAVHSHVDGEERWADNNFVSIVIFDERQELVEEFASLVRSL